MPNIQTGTPAPSANYIPKLSTATQLSNSVIYQDGTGNVGIGTTTPVAKLDVAGSIRLAGFILPGVGVNNYVLTSDANGGGAWKPLNAVTGGGTANAVPKFTGPNSVGDSTIYESGGNIGIGTTTPGQKLDVNGTVKLGGTAPNPGVFVNATGNVGIGTATPGQKLDVNGNVNINGSVQALQSMLALSGLIGRSSSAATPAGVFDGAVGGKILSGQVGGLEKFSVDDAGNVTASGTAQVTGLKLPTGASNGYVLTSDPAGNATWLPPSGGGAVGGTGTANAVPKFTDPTTIGDSLIYEDSGNVGIGDSAPQEKLTISPGSNLAVEMPSPNNIQGFPESGGGLVSGTYYFRIVAEDGVGGLTLPSDPRSPCPVNNPTTNRCRVTWDPVLGATQYRVYVVDRFDGEPDSYYVVTSGTSFVFNNQPGNIEEPFPSVATAFINKLSASGNSWINGGNIGIGTTTPQSPLAVKGSNEVLALEGSGITWMSYYPHGRATPSDVAWTGYKRGNMEFSIGNSVGEIGLIASMVSIEGNLLVTGTKNFVQGHPTNPTKEILYVSLEGGEAGTYYRGTGKLANGKAVIDLSGHFDLVTNEEGLTIQLTPRGEWLQLYVAKLTTKELVVEEAQRKSGQFDYFVQGVRKGYENHQVIRDKRNVDVSRPEMHEAVASAI